MLALLIMVVKRQPRSCPLYTISDFARVVGSPIRQAQGWVDHEVLRPFRAGRGKGTPRRFSRADILKGMMLIECRALFGSSFRPGSIKRGHSFANLIGALLPEELESFDWIGLSCDGKVAAITPLSAESIPDKIGKRACVMTFNMKLMRERLEKALKALE